MTEPRDIWNIDYNRTIQTQASQGWNGIFFVLSVNILLYMIAIIIFLRYGNSTNSTLFNLSKSKTKTRSVDYYSINNTRTYCQYLFPIRNLKNYLRRLSIFYYLYSKSTESLREIIGDEGAFYLTFQRYALDLFMVLSLWNLCLLLPTYLFHYIYYFMFTSQHKNDAIYRDKINSISRFSATTIRVIQEKSFGLWIPVFSCWFTTGAFLYFLYRLTLLYSPKHPSISSIFNISASNTLNNANKDHPISIDETTDTVHSSSSQTSSNLSIISEPQEYHPLISVSENSSSYKWYLVRKFSKYLHYVNMSATSLTSSEEQKLQMFPSNLSSRSLFITTGIPKNMSEDRLNYLLHEVFPSYISYAVLVYDLEHYKRIRNNLKAKQDTLDRLQIIQELRKRKEVPLALKILPGGSVRPNLRLVFDVCSFGYCRTTSIAMTERKLIEDIVLLHQEQSKALDRTMVNNHGTGRVIIVFVDRKYKAKFIKRVNHKSINTILLKYSKRSKKKARRIFDELNINKWTIKPAPEPDDIDWDSVSLPSTKRTALQWSINISITLLLISFTSPVAITATLSSGPYSGPAAQIISSGINKFGKWLSRLSPFAAEMMFSFTPVAILVAINNALLNGLYYAGKIEPAFTDSAKEKKILKASAVYLIFNTLFVPSFTFASINGLVAYFQHRKHILDVLGQMFLHNSGIFFVNFVIQRAFISTAAVLLRPSEYMQFLWLKSRALTDKEHDRATSAWKFYAGTQFALLISVMAVVITFSTVVPLIVLFGFVYMLLQYFADKYSLIYVRQKIPGRGAIARTATHTAVYCLLIYQAAMSGYFYSNGTKAQGGCVILLFILTVVIISWWYIADKHFQLQNDLKAVPSTEDQLVDDDLFELYHEPVVRLRSPLYRNQNRQNLPTQTYF